MDDGYIMLSRRFFNSEIWQAARPFSESEAWIDLIQSARFEPSGITSRFGSYEVTWGRGQYPASVRFLSKKWQRSERWVRSFINRLKKEKMITVDNSCGTSIITLINYDKYNPLRKNDKTSCDTVNDTLIDTLNDLNVSELRSILTHLLTHSVTHPAEKRHTADTNTKKDNNIITTTTPPRGVRACEGNTGQSTYRKFLESSLKSIPWLETLCMNYRMDMERITSLLREFVTDSECRGFDDTGKTLRDFKSHFNNWLLVRLRVENEQKQKNNGNRQGNGAAATYEQRRDEAANLVARILARNNA